MKREQATLRHCRLKKANWLSCAFKWVTAFSAAAAANKERNSKAKNNLKVTFYSPKSDDRFFPGEQDFL